MGIVKISDQMHENLRVASNAMSRLVDVNYLDRSATTILADGSGE